MARSDGTNEIWGTREELLLACAVGRHGTRSWDSVAMEVRARIPSPPLLTAQTCERRYHDLRRRITVEASGDARDGVESDAIPLLEELRRLRVAELRREVERYDVSIMSLQLRVQKLKEDRERSCEEEQPGDGGPDPLETEKVKKGTERSWNESNSTGPNASQGPVTASDGKLGGSALGAEHDDDDMEENEHVAEDDEKVAGEGSYNGSSDTVAKGAEVATPAEEPVRTNPAQQPDGGESGESVAESKGEATKESSDVQSSASLSRRQRGRREAVSGASSGGDEAEADEVSPVNILSGGESQPLVRFLEIIRSHRYSSMFESRLEIQEGTRYRRLIRQHMELQMVQAKVAEGAYAADAEFYRDLLLLFTNAVVFFPRSSAEYGAAVKLRRLVRKQIAISVPKRAPPFPVAAEERAALHSPAADTQPTVTEAETDPDPPGTNLLDKPSSVPSLVACRKRSSISGKAASKLVAAAVAAAAVNKEEEKPDTPTDKKEAECTEKKRTKERSALTGLRGLRASKGRGSSSGDAGGATKISTSNSVPRPTVDVSEAANAERNQHSNANVVVPAASVAKKRSAVNLLTRTGRRPVTSNGTLLEKLKIPGRRGNGEGGEQKRGGRADGKRDQGSRQASGASSASTSAKQAPEQSAPSKRGVGRPPKRPPPPLPPPPAKRAKDEVPPRPRTGVGTKRGRR